MSHFAAIPLVRSSSDARIVTKFYSEVRVVRLELASAPRLVDDLGGVAKWIDPGLDVLGQAKHHITPDHEPFLARYGLAELIGNDHLMTRPTEQKMLPIVRSLLDEALKLDAKWISVPQVPMVDDGRRNRLNRLLADLTRRWASERGFEGSFVLPVVATHRNQTKGKTQRAPKVRLVKECFRRSHAKAVWVVDSSLDDQRVAGDHQGWFQALVDFHGELRTALPSTCIFLGGPYWGLNLVLWARGLIDFPVVGVGTGFQYYLSGGFVARGKARIALSPLRRTVVVEGLQNWLQQAVEIKSERGDSRVAELRDLLRDWERLVFEDHAKEQVARFYKNWVDEIRAMPEGGRALGLYQDLSAAYVFGSDLPELPRSEKGRSKVPGRVAELLMLVTLG